ncbi:N-glycosylase/DNA lyase [Candidatus Omnitrophota bacterium]
MKDLIRNYKDKLKEIRSRLSDFKEVYRKGDKDVFAELCFCILTPQSKAILCDKALKELQKTDTLFKGSKKDIRFCLKGVRFPNNKARYLILAREFFSNGNGPDVKSKIDTKDLSGTREWLVKNVKGLGYKEASHFLRNIGFGKDLAILDRHILKNLKRYGIIKKIPEALSRRQYIDIEEKMKRFFKPMNISMEEIDLLFWSMETGMVFK